FLFNCKIDTTCACLQEFNEFLRVIHPFCAPIRDHTAEFLLKLGKQFKISFVMDLAEKFLINTIGWCNIKKLEIADKYSLRNLHVSLFINVVELNSMLNFPQKSSIYYDLSFKMKAELFEEFIRKFSNC
ncbi:hypothetical protein PMAYCL1PPCAC_24843, partial [Pristionchus mayeri]